MTKTFKYILAAFAVVTAASCAKELEDPNANPQQDVELVPMTVTVGTETKVTVADDKTLNWCDDDKIAIWDGYEFREFTVVETNGNTAIFEGQVATGVTKFRAVYPYAAAVSCDSEGAITATVPQVQALDGGNVADNGIVAVCQFNKGETLGFKTATGYLRVDVSYEDVSEIIIDGAAVAGTAQFNADGTVKSVATAAGSVSMTPVGENFTPGSYYVALLPGTTPAGEFHITLVRAEKGAVMTATKDIVVPRNEGFFAADTKLTESFLIKDAATLQAFLTDAPNYTYGQMATIVKDIDLTGVTLTAGGNFKGILDGRNHSIKNWTSNGVNLFNDLSSDTSNKLGAVVKNLKFDSSCNLTPKLGAERFGFIAINVRPFSVLENCENNADITTSAETIGKTYYGTLAGVTYGSVKNCRNNGNIRLDVSGDVTANVWFGGIIGYANVADQMKASSLPEHAYCMEGCQNNGDVVLNVGGKVLGVVLGGVAGGTSSANITTSSATRGTFMDCVNTGKVECVVKNGGSLEDNQGISVNQDSYHNIGGVVGYVEGSVVSCENRGAVKVQGPTLESNVTLKRGCYGGVAGFVLFSMTDCENHGSVWTKASWTNGTGGANLAGNNAASSFGGVVGQVGPTASATEYSFTNNHNYGTLTFIDWMPSSANSGAYFGGVAGYTTLLATSCSNNGAMSVDSKAGHTYVGGVVSYSTLGVESLTNNGDVTVVGRRTTATVTDGTPKGHIASEFRVGGIIAAVDSDKSINKCVNNKSLTVTTHSVDGNAVQMKIGGVLGRAKCKFNENVNNGKVTVNQATGTKGLTLGGVVGWLTECVGMTSGTNNGAVEFTTTNSACTSWVGGFAGYIDSSEGFSGLTNNAPITVNHTSTGGTCLLGGVVGNISNSNGKTIENLTNTAKGVITTTHLPNKLFVGGIIGQINKGKIITAQSLKNEGALNIVAPDTRTANFYVGGVVGISQASNTYNSCINSGNITLDAHTTNTGYCYVHGIAGEDDGAYSFTMSNCKNTGDIYVDCNDTKCGWQMGGIISYCGGGGTHTGSVCEANITLVGTSGSIHNVGGVMGYCARADYENCSYKGAITTNGSASDSYVGGIVGRSNNATMNFKSCTLKPVIKIGSKTYAGVLDGDLNAADRTVNAGTEGKVTKILSGSSVNGVAVTSALEADLIVGTRNAKTVNTTYCQFVTE